jgi:hypothetical protein
MVVPGKHCTGHKTLALDPRSSSLKPHKSLQSPGEGQGLQREEGKPEGSTPCLLHGWVHRCVARSLQEVPLDELGEF